MRDAFGTTFDVDGVYLNTPSIGLPPQPVVAAVTEAVTAWGRAETSAPQFDAPVATARAAFAQLVGVPASSVVLGTAVSGLLGLVAASLPPGARVLTADREFTSVTFPFVSAGHEVVELPLDELPERTRAADVVAVSVVASADGAVVDLDALRAEVGPDTLVVLDATQSLGWLPADLSWADVVVAGGYKWLLSPRGAAWMALSDRLAERIAPVQSGWYAGGWDAIYGLPLRLHPDARRFDLSPVWLAQVGAAVALPWIASLDAEAVRDHSVGLANRVRVGLDLPPAESAIVSVRHPDAPDRLGRAGVRCAVRGGAARLGFHLHNTEDDADEVVAAVRGRSRD
ncbi:aminotransferase class V-fold PLP-dependent enzyme [Actinomycetospora lemnae]|uniref:Aminotransferase class V-fold PLP-dependent enzyme n=1 Tax=Actinomycetospora lemnae TaxID=3019891 RepID=A0ABT5SR92_9PSEU|nr:aminotransferase class V-fold PLP-dependent enzyme [Actinomycetospora sp. DW7H6]MDD7964985.1 aminotransferase class V-fold PLP-dependent enzyme [Actinomycetospora sp. DW7H6]